MIIKTSFRRRNTGLDKQKLFTFVLICVSIDIDVPENQAELQRKGWDVYFITAEKGGNLGNNVPRSSTFHRITSKGDHFVVNTTKISTSGMRLNLSTWYSVCTTFPKSVDEQVNAKWNLNLCRNQEYPVWFVKECFVFSETKTYLFWI